MKVLLVSLYFPPAGGGGVQRTLKTATHLPALGIETHVLAPDDPKWVHRDDELEPPTQAWVHRARYVGPRGRRPADELHGTSGLERLGVQTRLFGRRLLVPDENVPWNLTAIPAAIRIARREGIDIVLTTSPPSSVHFVGAAVKRRPGHVGSLTCATRSSLTRTGGPSGGSSGSRSRASTASRGSWRGTRTRSSALPRRSPRRRARSILAGVS